MPDERQDTIPIPSLWRPARSVFEGIRYEHLVSGIAGGAIAAQMLHPLDLIRIRFSGGHPANTRRGFSERSSKVSLDYGSGILPSGRGLMDSHAQWCMYGQTWMFHAVQTDV